MTEFLQALVSPLANLGAFIYLLAFVVTFVESLVIVGHFVPGTVFLAFLGFLCYLGIFDFGVMLSAIFLAHFGGELSNYYLGRHKGRAMFSVSSRYLKPEILGRIEEKFHSHRLRLIFVGQFIGLIRPFVSFVAGAIHYPLTRLIVPMALADLLWALVHLGLGFILGASWEHAARYVADLSLLIFASVFIGWFSAWLTRTLIEHAGELGAWIELMSRKIHQSLRYGRLQSGHPRLFMFLEARLSLTRSWGIGATAGWLAALVLLINFIVAFHNMQTDETWRHVDQSVVNLLTQLRHPSSDRVFLFLGSLGRTITIVLITLLASVLCLWKRQFKSLALILGSVVLVAVLSRVFEALATQPAEVMPALTRAQWKSLQSVNPALVVTLFSSLYLWLWSHPGGVRMRALLAFLLVVIVLLTGFASIYLGLHFPGGVWAGYSLGLAGTVFVATLAQNISRLREAQKQVESSALIILAAGLLVAVGLSGLHHAEKVPLWTTPPRTRITLKNPAELILLVPRQARGLPGQPVAPIALVFVGDPLKLEAHLVSRGWKSVQPESFFTRQIRAPIFPAFVDDQPAERTLLKQMPDRRLVLRLWRTAYTLRGEEPTWVGSVTAESLSRGFFGMVANYAPSPDLDLAVDDLATHLRGLPVQRVDGFRERGLYSWKFPFFTHGGALLVNASGRPLQ